MIFKTLRIVWKLQLVLHINITALYLKKKIFSILIRLFLTQLVSKVGVKLQEITLYPFKFGRSKLTFDFLPRTWLIIIKENYFWWLINCIIRYTFLVDYTPFATVSIHFKLFVIPFDYNINFTNMSFVVWTIYLTNSKDKFYNYMYERLKECRRLGNK